MCRWLAYTGEPIYLEELMFETEHSLIEQSLAARMDRHPTSGDGFGIGWYGNREVPGVYKDLRPAWNDSNLRSLAGQIRSGMFLAHVRATTGTAVQRSNCHPFQHERWLFVHNGVVPDFQKVRRDLTLEIASELFPCIGGTTDSELLFYLALTFGLREDPVAALERMAGVVERVGKQHDVENPLHMTLGISDGRSLLAVRYSSEGRTSTLFRSKEIEALHALQPSSGDGFPDNACAVVSEPLTDLVDHWEAIPESTATVILDGRVETRPFRPTLR
jgi:glutamine amidotransferase